MLSAETDLFAQPENINIDISRINIKFFINTALPYFHILFIRNIDRLYIYQFMTLSFL
jgi:hypothetical protein